MIQVASNKKQYTIEAQPLLRALSSGNRFTDKSMEILSAKTGDKVWYAVDTETGKVYVFKSESGEGSTIGKNKTFSNTGFRNALLKLAKGASIMKDGTSIGTMELDTDIKAGLQVKFSVSETATERVYHEVTFKEATFSEKEAKEAAENIVKDAVEFE